MANPFQFRIMLLPSLLKLSYCPARPGSALPEVLIDTGGGQSVSGALRCRYPPSDRRRSDDESLDVA